MSFKLEKWSTLGAQTKRGVAYQKFSYLDETDGQAKVTDDGFFNEVKLNVSVNDVIEVLDTTVTPAFAYFIRVKDAGGLYTDLSVEVVNQGGAGKDAVQNSAGTSTTGNIVAFADDTGKQVVDSGINAQQLSEKTTQAFDKANEVNTLATNAETSATNAVSKVNELYDEFANLKLWDKDKSYKKGNFVRVDAKPYSIIYVSAVENNLNNQPPLNPEHGSDAFWTYYSHEYTGKEEFSANIEEAELVGDGSTVEYVLTDFNVNLKPESNNQILGVFFKLPDDTIKLISDKEYTVYRRADGKSVILFNQALPADTTPGKKNIVVKGADPKIIEVLHAVPIGGSMIFHTPVLPQGWLELDGSVITKGAYPELVLALTNNPNATQAVLPDMRGVVPRGWDNGRGLDPNRELGSFQNDEIKAHSHTTPIIARWNDHNNWTDGFDNTAGTSSRTLNFESSVTGGDETRMKNNAVIFAIKAFDTVVNTGVVDLNGLNQAVANLTQKAKIIDDKNEWVNYNAMAWRGTITSQGGQLLSSATNIIASKAWSWGNPTFDKVNKVWNCLTWEDRLGVGFKHGTFNTSYDVLEFTTRQELSAYAPIYSGGVGFGLPNSDDIAPLIRLATDTKTLQMYMSTSDASWNVFDNIRGSTVVPLDTPFDIRWKHDRVGTGDVTVELSLDGLAYDSPAKVWTVEATANTTSPLHLVADNNDMFITFASHYEYDTNAGSAQKLYADYCSFKLDNVEMIASNIQSGFTAGRDFKTVHQFIGYNDNEELISEFCFNRDGSDLWQITGDKRWVYSDKPDKNGVVLPILGYVDKGGRRVYDRKVHPEIYRSKNDYTGGIEMQSLVPRNASGISLEYVTNNAQIAPRYSLDVDPNYQMIDRALCSANGYQTNFDIPIVQDIDKLNLYVNNYGSADVVLFARGFSLNREIA